MSGGREVFVLGAGMVGVASALALQEAGHAVTLVDRGAPGRETSYGNAGIIQGEAVEPYALPRDLASLGRIALRTGNEVNWHLDAMPSHLAVLWKYFLDSGGRRYARIAASYARLIGRATADHAPLIAAAGAEALVRREGYREIFHSEAKFDAARRDAARLERTWGTRSRALSGAELAAAEPALKKRLPGALHWLDAWTCADPGGLVQAYAELFAARGGRLAQGDAMTLEASGAGWRVQLAEGPETAAEAVVALGPWSPALLAPLGYRIAQLRKRGYHRHYAGGATLDLPIMDTGATAVLSPMRRGTRIATGAEIAREAAGPTPRQLARAEHAARELIDLGQPVEDAPWLGNRPCMPDMLPVVGRAPRHRNLWFHFGHGHQGFTLGPTTARLLAEEMSGAPSPEPALSPERL